MASNNVFATKSDLRELGMRIYKYCAVGTAALTVALLQLLR